MSERARNIITIVVMAAMVVTLIVLVATSPSDINRVQAIGEQIKCPVCQGESIANSPSSMARDMMSLVAERVSAGDSDTEIIEELLSSYSGAVLLDPPVGGPTLALWLAPVAALIGGAGVILWWRRHPPEPNTDAPKESARARRLAPLLVLGGSLAVIVVVAGFFLQDRAGPASGVANLAGQDLEDVSNETMEAVITANADHPQVDGMRLALAERYYEAGDYSAAFPHYLAVAQSTKVTGSQAVSALVRLGWMAWDGNDEAETAIGLFDQALAIDSSSSTALYLKGQVLWCGTGDLEAAIDLFEDVLADPELSPDARARVESDLAAARDGSACT
ncbi:MAG TPA: cytochrome c-type biogenesis protein CcmH [Acidimicrobiia bacterium]